MPDMSMPNFRKPTMPSLSGIKLPAFFRLR